MPSPKCALRWLAFSPVPSQTTFEFFGSTTTQQRVNDPPLSNAGVKVVPRLVVFQSPPNAVATYQVLGDFGSIAMSCTRPVEIAGPMLRNSRPFSTSAVNRSVAGACRATVVIVAARDMTATAAVSIRFDVTGSLQRKIRVTDSGRIRAAGSTHC